MTTISEESAEIEFNSKHGKSETGRKRKTKRKKIREWKKEI